MRRWIAAKVAAWRWRRFTRDFDRQLEEARRLHKPVAPILAAKREFTHAALRGRGTANG